MKQKSILLLFILIHINFGYSQIKLLKVVPGHNGSVSVLKYSPNGKIIASGGRNSGDFNDDGTIKLWSSIDGQFLGTIGKIGDESGIIDFQFLANNKILYFNHDRINLIELDTTNLNPYISYNFTKKSGYYPGYPMHIDISSTNRLSGYSWGYLDFDDINEHVFIFGSIILFDSTLSDTVVVLDYPATTFSFSHNDSLIAFACDFIKDTVKIININNSKIEKIITSDFGSIESLVFSEDNQHLYVLNGSSSYYIVNLSTGEIQFKVTGRNSGIMKVDFINENRYYTLFNDGELLLWKYPEKEVIESISLPVISGISFSPDGSLFTVGIGSNIKTYKYEDFEEKWSTQSHSYTISSLCFSPDSKYLATSTGSSSGIKIYSIPEMVLVKQFPNNIASNILYSPNGEYLAISGWTTLKLLNLKNELFIDLLDKNDSISYRQYYRAMAFSPDSKIFAFSGDKGPIKFWNISENKYEEGLNSIYGTVAYHSMKYSNNGKYFAYGNVNDKADIYLTETNTCYKTYNPLDPNPGVEPYVKSVDISYDNNYLLSKHKYKAYLWNIETGEMIDFIPFATSRNCFFVPFSKNIYGINDTGYVGIWDYSFKQKTCYRNYPVAQTAVNFSPDMKYIASGGRDASILLWSVADSILNINDDPNFQDIHFQIFPNPASEYIEINVGARHAVPVWNEQIQIFNVYGVKMNVEVQNFEPLRIDVSGFPDGMYFLKLSESSELSEGYRMYKFVVIK